jgi:hypothetical protein
MTTRRSGLVGGAAMFSVALIASAGSYHATSVQPQARPASPATAAVQTCTDSNCHIAEHRWLTSEPGGREHFGSIVRLQEAQGKATAYGQAIGLADVTAPAGMCVRCHGSRAGQNSEIQGIGCESCHGAATGYLAFHARTPRDYEGAVQRGLRNLRQQPEAGIRVCRDCHVLADRAAYSVLITAGHPGGAGWKASVAYDGIDSHWRTGYLPGVIDAAERALLARASILDRRSGGGGAPPITTGSAPPPARSTPPPPTGSAPPTTTGSARQPMPDFPWPPPAPSAQTVLPDSLFRTAGRPTPSLSAVGSALVNALERARYSEYSYYRAPGGFALVARLERIDADGTPMPEAFRFLLPGSQEPFSITAYVKQLFFAPTGLYRQIVFTVTDQPFAATGTQLNAAAAARLLSQGANALPREFDALSFTDGHRVTVLIYEFRKGTAEGDVSTLTPSRLGARAHLDKSGIYSALAVR